MNRTYTHMVSYKNFSGSWKQEFLIGENAARDFANRCCKDENNCIVELLSHGRHGYTSVRKVTRHHKGSPLWRDDVAKKDFVV